MATKLVVKILSAPFLLVLVFFLFISASLVSAAQCGDILHTDTFLNQSLQNCNANGLIIRQDNLVLDCQGNKISGNQSNGFGIEISGGEHNNITIKDCHVSDFKTGIKSSQCHNLTLQHNNITDISSYAVNINGGNDLVIENNQISQTDYFAFHISNVEGAVISNNTLLNTGLVDNKSLALTGIDSLVFEKNTIDNSAQFQDTPYLALNNNTFQELSLTQADDSTITNNIITSFSLTWTNTFNINDNLIQKAELNDVENGQITDNDFGSSETINPFYVYTGSFGTQDITIENNTFIGKGTLVNLGGGGLLGLDNITFVSNLLENNTNGTGLHLMNIDNSLIRENIIRDNKQGIVQYFSPGLEAQNTTFEFNQIYDNKIGFYPQGVDLDHPDMNQLAIQFNNFYDNNDNIFTLINSSYVQRNLGKNYWGTSTIEDANSTINIFNGTIDIFPIFDVLITDLTPRFYYTCPGTADCNGSDITLVDYTASLHGIDTRLWDLGNGHSDNQENFTYVYPAPGNYTITLDITDNLGQSDSYAQNVTILYHPNQDCNDFAPNITSVNPDGSQQYKEDNNINFNAQVYDLNLNSTVYNESIEVVFDFGDNSNTTVLLTSQGSPEETAQTSHTYNNPGTYLVMITAVDSTGLTDSQEFNLTIKKKKSGGKNPGGSSDNDRDYACSNGIDDDGDGLIDYPYDPGCATRNDDDEYNACQERWVCQPWSNCTNSTKTRVCEEVNGCETEEYKPLMEKSCSMPAEPDQDSEQEPEDDRDQDGEQDQDGGDDDQEDGQQDGEQDQDGGDDDQEGGQKQGILAGLNKITGSAIKTFGDIKAGLVSFFHKLFSNLTKTDYIIFSLILLNLATLTFFIVWIYNIKKTYGYLF